MGNSTLMMRTSRRERRQDDGDEHSTGRTFPVVIALISFAYQLLAALACRQLSVDTPYVDLGISTYAWIGCVVSLLGVVGAVKNHSVFVVAFANFLLLDTIVSAACRVLLIHLFENVLINEDLCDAPLASHDLVSDAYVKGQMQNCLLGLRAVQVVFAMILISMTCAQGMLALAVRQHGTALARSKSLSTPAPVGIIFDDEKRRPFEDC